MSSGEVQAAKSVIVQQTVEGAEKQGIYVSYVGLGEDFDQHLTEEITVAPGCNYFCVKSCADFQDRIASQLASCFFQTVREVTVKIISKTHKVAGVYGGGKEGTVEEKDVVGWTRDRQHIYSDDKTTALVSGLTAGGLNTDVTGLIVNQSIEEKAVIALKEKSVFPAPVSAVPGSQLGGWVMIKLEPVTSAAGGGSAEFELSYKRMDNTEGKNIKWVSLAPPAAMSEGMEKALVLQQFVAEVKSVLDNKDAFAFPEEFLAWFEVQKKKHDLSKQVETLTKLQESLDKLKKAKEEKGARAGQPAFF